MLLKKFQELIIRDWLHSSWSVPVIEAFYERLLSRIGAESDNEWRRLDRCGINIALLSVDNCGRIDGRGFLGAR